MSNLRKYAPEMRSFADARTGRRVIQLTGDNSENRATYAALCPFDASEHYVVFASKRTGRWEIFRAEIQTGEIAQLSNREGVQWESHNVAPPGREVFYAAGREIWAVDVATGEERRAVDASAITSQPLRSYLTFDPQGRRVLIHYRPHAGGADALAVAATDGSFIQPVFFRDEFMQHPRWVPHDERTASFAVHPDRQNDPNETYERRARAWQLDLETGRAFPLLVMPPGWRCTHEFWAPDGSRIFAHKKHVPNWVPCSIVSVPKGGGEITTHYTDTRLKLGHSGAGPDGTWLITDVQEPNDNPLLRIDLTAGRAEILCWPDAGISPDKSRYAAHCHPSVSPSGRWAVYTSDRSGIPAVYLVELS